MSTVLLVSCATSAPAPTAQTSTDPGDAIEVALNDIGALRARAIAAHTIGDAQTFLKMSTLALKLDPDSSVHRYNRACGLARTGRPAEAMDELQRLVDQGVDFGMATDPDFASLRDHARFKTLVQRAHDQLTPVDVSALVAETTDVGVWPTALAWDASRERYLVSTMFPGAVHTVQLDGAPAPFIDLVVDGVKVSPMGMAIDAERDELWVVGGVWQRSDQYNPASEAVNALFRVDLKTQTVLSTHVYPGKSAQHGLSNLVLLPDHTVVMGGEDGLHTWTEGGGFQTLQLQPRLRSVSGLARSDDGQLYATADERGIARVDLRAGTASWLNAPADETLRGSSTLAWHDGYLVTVNSGKGHPRLLELDLSDDGARIDSARTLVQGVGHPVQAAGGTVVADTFVYATPQANAERAGHGLTLRAAPLSRSQPEQQVR